MGRALGHLKPSIASVGGGATTRVAPIGANLPKLGFDRHVFSVARGGGVEWFWRRRAIFARRAWGQSRRRAPRRSSAGDAKRRFLRGRPVGRVTEMVRDERLG